MKVQEPIADKEVVEMEVVAAKVVEAVELVAKLAGVAVGVATGVIQSRRSRFNFNALAEVGKMIVAKVVKALVDTA